MADLLQQYSFLWESLDFYLILASVLVCLYQLVFYIRLSRASRPSAPAPIAPSAGVSVIVCARNEQVNLRDYLHALLTQDYPCFEVIVVDDGSEDATSILLEQCARDWSNLYHTFVPRGARVISSKKLALTIGIKAAHYDYILLTDADCRPESRYWIREMMSGFSDQSTELVLGFSPYFRKKGLLNRMLRYDTLFNGLQYMGMAKSGHPYMGVGRNLAYRKQTFFEHNGFQGILNKQAGDDDLFINKISKKSNTCVVCNSDSITWSVPKVKWRAWLHQKRRHLSVSPHYRSLSKLRIGLEPVTRGMMYGLLIAGIILKGYFGYLVVALFLLRLIMQMSIINQAAKKLHIGTFGLGLIFYDIVLPIITLSILVSQSLRKQTLYW